MKRIKTTMKRSQSVKLLVMGAVCLGCTGYGAWQVWSRIPERTREYQTYQEALTVFDELTEIRVERQLDLTPEQAAAYTRAESTLAQFKDEKPQPPSKYDSLINFWVWFVGGAAGLPFVALPFWRYRNGGWVLEEDGRLRSPKGAEYPPDEVADIDMTTWRGLINPQASNKTTWQARLILKDGTSEVMDDYLWEGVAGIIAHYAHRFHPTVWAEDGEPIEEGLRKASEALSAKADSKD
ncbi:MAG: hypothetical protein VXY94_10040 [Planctomycetota bacterium]|nr:hypothetical protein [Planctomycetota bacterium]MEC8734598.1 hypothetical protein [Planctomycetota bacterium]MEC8819218.1 hypothetical protein [Planctomycetota bacterium]MEC9158190.1 hypothetical protein [Planctomycetota bacterium]MEC9233205.1 hypothetical protein [Planctomycetota bacterium]